MKQCSKCKEWKDESEFRKHIHHSDGLSSLCKSCKSEYDRAYRKKNKNKLEKQNKEYRKNNKLKAAKQSKKYYKNNKEKIKNYNSKYYIINKKKLIIWQNIYKKNRIKTDLNFKLIENIRNRIRIALKKESKTGTTIALLGCTPKKAKEHLEKQFKKGMTWKNYGIHGWHIDHIKPCSSFDLSDPKQQKQCFHYTNLQPLWARENLSKGSKYEK